MPQYVLFMYADAELDQQFRDAAQGKSDGDLTKEDFAAEYQKWQQFSQDLKDAGMLVGTTGLAGVDAATTVKVSDGETQITDGPFAETKEILAGYYVIEAPDLDTALEYAARVPTAERGSVEVRPAWG